MLRGPAPPAAAGASVPSSRFAVGAAALVAAGRVVPGCPVAPV
ncbi:cytidine deaminase, partial [Mycobacterium tuberculosis]